MALLHRKILITRDEKQAGLLVTAIERLGGTAICFPTISIAEPGDWRPVDDAICGLSNYDWIIFASANSVRFFMQRAEQQGIEKPRARLAVIGSKTGAMLQSFGLKADVTPAEFTAASLINALEQENMVEASVLLPASAIAPDDLYNSLLRLGARVDRIVVYQNRPHRPENTNEVVDSILKGEIDLFTFYSPSAVHNFAKIVGDEAIDAIRRQAKPIAVIGSTTATAVRGLELSPAIEPLNSTTEELLSAIVDYYKILRDDI